LEVAKTYATSHSQREEKKYATHYNLRSKEKHFEVGEKVLILMPDSTASRAFSKWTDLLLWWKFFLLTVMAGTKRHFHANKCANFMCELNRWHMPPIQLAHMQWVRIITRDDAFPVPIA